MKTVDKLFLEPVKDEQDVFEKRQSILIQFCDLFYSITTACFYVMDIKNQKICILNPDNLFGYSFSGDDLDQGFDFYKKIVFPDDLRLWSEMRNAVLRYLQNSDDNRDEIDYFSCTFRLQRKYSFHTTHLPQMISHRMKHIWEGDKLCYLICSIGYSVGKSPGNLRMHNKNGLQYEEYNFITKRWGRKMEVILTEREKAILLLNRQGENANEIANYLYKGYNTIRNQTKAIFSKLGVNSMQEAVEYACFHRLLFPKQDITPQLIISQPKRTRVLFNEEKFYRIQKCLDEDESIHQIAKNEGISESAIRYWIKKGRLICKQK